MEVSQKNSLEKHILGLHLKLRFGRRSDSFRHRNAKAPRTRWGSVEMICCNWMASMASWVVESAERIDGKACCFVWLT